MLKRLILLISFCSLMAAGHFLSGQQLSFRHLGAQQGMRSLTILNSSIDKYGFIWLSTSDGLVRFDGKQVTNYDVISHPQLKSDHIRYVFCDSRNQVWVCTPKGLVRLDQHRQMHNEIVNPSIPEVPMRFCFEDNESRVYALTYRNAFSKGIKDKVWRPEQWLDSIMPDRDLYNISRFDKDRFLLTFPTHGIFLVNLKEKKQEAFVNVKWANCAIRYDDHHILIGTRGGFQLILASLSDTSKVNTIQPPSFFTLNRQHEEIKDIVRAVDNHFYMTIGGEGLLVLDYSLTRYQQYKHDPANPSTLIDDGLRNITADSTGMLILGSLEGVNYTNVRNQAIRYINYMKDDLGEISDDRVVSFAEDKDHRIWLCTRNSVFIYDPNTNITKKVEFPISEKYTSESLYPKFIARDMHDNMWVVFLSDGIGIFTPDGVMQKFLSNEDYQDTITLIANARSLRDGHDGYMYVGTEDGVFRISQYDFRIDTFPEHPGMRLLHKERILDMLPVENGIWVTSSPHGGAWYYSFTEKILKKFDPLNGLASNRVYAITKDLNGNIFAGTYNGLSIIDTNDHVVNYFKGNGLVSAQIEAIEADNDGSIWMTNINSLLKYDGRTGKIYKLGSRQGVPGVNYAINASAKLSSGHIVFGASSGFVIIDPAAVSFDEVKARLFVFYRNENGDEIELAPCDKLHFRYTQRQIRFSFAINDIVINDQVMYKYRLTSDADHTWSSPSSNSFIEFNLKPGSYKLDVEAFDGYDWIRWSDHIRITVHPAWWQEWWFIALVSLAILVGLWTYYRSRIRKYKTEVIVARQISDLEAKALRAQMNPHFVFNSLNAIQECIVTGRIEEAYTYLSKFSRLLRMVLEHSDVTEVTLQEELEVLGLYISLEKLRFKDDMQYRFHLDEELDAEEIYIPPMLIQPHIENAIWHGLRHKDTQKHLMLSITEKPLGYLEVIVEDDGIGRKKASEIRERRLGGNKHNSKGKLLSENRMELLRKSYPFTSMIIIDLYDANGVASGTKVILSIPMVEKKSGHPNTSLS